MVHIEDFVVSCLVNYAVSTMNGISQFPKLWTLYDVKHVGLQCLKHQLGVPMVLVSNPGPDTILPDLEQEFHSNKLCISVDCR